MKVDQLLAILKEHPLVASVQAPPGTPLDDAQTITRMAQASHLEGARVLRIQGTRDIAAVRAAIDAPVIGLVKRDYPDSEVVITPTRREVEEVVESGAEVVALDATGRRRPGGESFAGLAAQVHAAGCIVLADCDSPREAAAAVHQGADLVATTLCGYTGGPSTSGPDLATLREMVQLGAPTLAEGRFSQEWEVRAALQIGATGVVVGGAINDPLKQTRRFVQALSRPDVVAAFDLGGTWLRWGRFEAGRLIKTDRIRTPADPAARLAWMQERIEPDIERVGVSSGGTIDPVTNTVIEAKPLIPDHVGVRFAFGDLPTVALNDGLAAAWGHACLAEYAGRRVATLALGTGVGFGLVDRGTILMGPQGQYPRLNDLGFVIGTVEDALGGAALTENPTPEQRERARDAARAAVEVVHSLMLPDVIVLCGAVGLTDWLDLELPKSPFGADAGLYGAAALAIYPPGGAIADLTSPLTAINRTG